ncbi:MAG: hypothetical protein KDK05_20400, partial [Candidatus Competibacteraceae bacterium]|nr:hypothetical protein [Candidatus Competibacteraceae bacterium]
SFPRRRESRNVQGAAKCRKPIRVMYQNIERNNFNVRTWIKRLVRIMSCFSKSELMHNTVIGLLINQIEFKRDIHAI